MDNDKKKKVIELYNEVNRIISDNDKKDNNIIHIKNNTFLFQTKISSKLKNEVLKAMLLYITKLILKKG
jgi:hypothetical protein